MSIDEPDINFCLVRLGQTVSKEITVNNMSQIITTWSIKDSPEFASSEDDMVKSFFCLEFVMLLFVPCGHLLGKG